MPISTTVTLVPDLVWCVPDADTPLDARLHGLLAAIKKHATLRAAARETRLSYRAAWGLLIDTGRRLGVPLVELQQGRGARLTEAGERFLAATERVSLRLRDSEFALQLETAPSAAARRSRTRLTLIASHDMLLAAFCDQWAKPRGIVGDIAFRGSIESLKALARGEADVAGFHAVAPGDRGVAGGFRRLLDPRRDSLIRFADREQGLIVPKGNPKGLRTLADVAALKARFVNRQRGSGTRLLVDQLLRRDGIGPPSIRGYETEEYTHLAVAATVAVGQADVGFGLKAAATRFDLDFVPVHHETYWLAVRTRRVGSDLIRRLCGGLSGEPLRNAVRNLDGYSIDKAGESVALNAADT